MVWKPITLLEFSTETKEWTKRRYEKYSDYLAFIKSCYKVPGEYNFKNTEYWIEPAIKFEKDKRYTDYHPASKEYKEFYLFERRKCEQGLIIDNVFISPDLYWFLNYCPILNKVEMRETFPDIWDGHYHYDLYLYLAWLEDEDGGGTKARQKGISLYHMARIARRVWFGNRSTLKVIGFEEEYVLAEWGIMQGYRDHINEHTGWYREFNPGEVLNWEQKKEVIEGISNKRKFFKGNKSRVKGATTKKNMAKAVGGPALEIYATEAGIYQNLKKVKGYVDPNLKMGSVKTGMFVFMGAVGELKDAADLQEFCFNPIAYNIRPVIDTFSGSGDPVAFFFPDEWNYIYKDEDTGEIVKCYDKNGNSDIELAIKFLELEESKQKGKDESAYKLWKSQHPRTLQDAFDQREDNPFPTTGLKQLEQELISKKDIIVKFERDGKGKVIHKFCDDVPVSKLKPNPNENNEGAVIIYEFPIANPPFGLYYAGVDPIHNIETSTSKSLMCIKIFMATHERDGKICPGYEVANYIGRHKKVATTYEKCLDLIEFYNARVASESNVRDFTDWMIRQGKVKYMMRRREIVAIGEMMPNSTIADEIGVRMEGEFKKKCIEKTIHYMEEPIADTFNLETGEGSTVLGLRRLKDKMMIKECLRWTPKLNTDRLVAWMLAYIAAEGNTNRHIIKEVKGANQPPPRKQITKLGSPFTKTRMNPIKKLPSPFRR